jgi:hypothetical protein
MTTTHFTSVVSKLAQKCDYESDIDKKINLLYKINSLLPKQNQLNIPSLLTDDYIDTALFRISEYAQNRNPLNQCFYF